MTIYSSLSITIDNRMGEVFISQAYELLFILNLSRYSSTDPKDFSNQLLGVGTDLEGHGG